MSTFNLNNRKTALIVALGATELTVSFRGGDTHRLGYTQIPGLEVGEQIVVHALSGQYLHAYTRVGK